MNRSELLRLARVGAQARLQVLQAEVQEIFRQFPDLRHRGRAGGVRKAAGSATAKRGRRKMSAAQRRAVSERMKRRWAEWRKKNKKNA